jgi:hypothetical protein
MTLEEWLRNEATSQGPKTIVVSLHRGATDEVVGDPITLVAPTVSWASKKLLERAREDHASEGAPRSPRYIVRSGRRGFSIHV